MECRRSKMADSPPRPTARPGLDWRTLPIGPTEAFVLSRLDGRSDPSQIALMTGVSEAEVIVILDRLEGLGAISFRSDGFKTPPPPKAPHLPPAPSAAPAPTIIDTRPKPPVYDATLLDEPADLDLKTKAHILELEARLPRANHYEILGVQESAERSEIKQAYFSLIQRFHTDRYFGKELGIFRSKLERISSALTKAQDTLSRAKTRAEYDDYLQVRRETRGARDSLPPTGAPPQGPEEADANPTPAIPRAPLAPQIESGQAIDPPHDSSSPEESSDPVGVDPATARKLLARKLGFRQGEARPPGSPSSSPPSDNETTRERIARELKARFEAKSGEQSGAAQHYVAMAETARAGKDYSSVVNALRIAASLAPSDPAIHDALAQASAEADRELADKFAQQAQYEQRDGHYDRAVRSYERAARGKEGAGHLEDAARFYHEAAICAAKEGASLKRVAELARHAVGANGKKVEYRLDLARAYERIGMRSSAQGEVMRALELEPENESAKALQRQLR